jgi:hypothetical protein
VCYAGEDGMEYRVGLKLGISGQVMDHSMFRPFLLVCPRSRDRNVDGNKARRTALIFGVVRLGGIVARDVVGSVGRGGQVHGRRG